MWGQTISVQNFAILYKGTLKYIFQDLRKYWYKILSMGVVEVTEHGADCHCHLSSSGNNKSDKLFSPIKGKMKVLKKIKKRMGLG